MAMDSDIVIWVPAHTSSVHLLRTVAASASARFELSVDDIDDIRLAVTEAASELLAERPSGTTLCLRLSDEGSTLRVTVALDGPAPQDGPAVRSAKDSFAWQVLLALCGDVRIQGDDLELEVSFSKARRPAPAAR